MVGKELLAALKKEEEVQLIVNGRKSGKEIPRPVWFALRDNEILFLPVKGSSSQWYKNVLKIPQVRIVLPGQAHSGAIRLITDKGKVAEVVKLFEKKYGAGDIRKYYSRLNVAAGLSVT